jgi:hypothetical protein
MNYYCNFKIVHSPSPVCFRWKKLSGMKSLIVLSLLSQVLFGLADDAGSESVVSGFMSWFANNGGILGPVDITSFEGQGRGVIATKSIKTNSEVAIIPLRLIISTETVRSSSDNFDKGILKAFPNDDDIVTAKLLLEEWRSDDSLWAPYLKMLQSTSFHAD